MSLKREINVSTPFGWIDKETAFRYFLENGKYTKFSLAKTVYYKYARPCMPLFIRHFAQNRVTRSIVYKENFIWDELVKKIAEHPDFNGVIGQLYPENKQCALLLTHDVETQAGFNDIPRIITLESKYNFKSVWNLVPYKYAITAEVLEKIKDAGHEIGIHGYNHDGKLFMNEAIFQKRAEKINRAIVLYGARGFRSPMVQRNPYLLQRLEVAYDGSYFDYDPFQPTPGGTGSIWPYFLGKLVEIPYTLPQDHVLKYLLQVTDISIWKTKLDWLVKNRGVITVLTHPDYLEGKWLGFYEELLQELVALQNIWHVLPHELALRWRNYHETASLQNHTWHF